MVIDFKTDIENHQYVLSYGEFKRYIDFTCSQLKLQLLMEELKQEHRNSMIEKLLNNENNLEQ